MHAHDHDRHSRRFTTSAAVMAVVLPGSFLALTAAPASAAPLPATYSADAHADIVGLGANVLLPLAPGPLVGAKIGHSRSTVASTAGGGTATGSSSNLDGSALFGTVPLTVDTETVTAAPSADPAPRALVPVAGSARRRHRCHHRRRPGAPGPAATPACPRSVACARFHGAYDPRRGLRGRPPGADRLAARRDRVADADRHLPRRRRRRRFQRGLPRHDHRGRHRPARRPGGHRRHQPRRARGPVRRHHRHGGLRRARRPSSSRSEAPRSRSRSTTPRRASRCPRRWSRWST